MSSTVAAQGMRERWVMSHEARWLTFVTAALLAFGLAVLYSASALLARNSGYPSTYYLGRQLAGAAAGMVAFAVAAKLDAERWRGWAWPLMWATIAAMLLTLILPESLAPRINGSKRFLFGASFQPSELGKLAVVVWCSMLVIKKGDAMRRLTKGLLPFLVVIGVLGALAALQPDLSVAMLYTLLMGVILYAGGARVGHFVAVAIIAFPVLWAQIVKAHYALLRLISFASGDEAMQTSFQLKQSLIAVGTGGLFGVGFGEGQQQAGFLPYPYSDFIASNIGEEWGFLGIAAVVVAFGAYGWLGFRIARQARSPFLQLVAVGLTFTTVLTAYLHVGVVVGLLPTTGLTLPFVSYGRSNLLLSLFFTGILVNIGSTRERVAPTPQSSPVAVPA